MKTCDPGKIPREDAVGWKASVPLPGLIPLLSRRSEMAGRVHPLQCQWVTAAAVTRVEPWNTLYPTPDFVRGWDYFLPSPRQGNVKFKMQNAKWRCAFGTVLNHLRSRYLNSAFSILHSAFPPLPKEETINYITNIQTILIADLLDMQKLTNEITPLNVDNKRN